MIPKIADSEISQLKNKISLLEVELQRAQSRIPETNENDEVFQSPETMEAQLDEIEQKIDEVQQDTKDTNEKVRELEVVVEQGVRHNIALQNERDQLSWELQQVQGQYQEVENELNQILKEIDEI